MITPSISTSVAPPTTAAMTTRAGGSSSPAGSSVVVMTDLLLTAKVSWNPLRDPALEVTCTDWSASISACGAGMVTTLPIRSSSCTLLPTDGPRQQQRRRARPGRGRQRDPQPPPGDGEFVRV